MPPGITNPNNPNATPAPGGPGFGVGVGVPIPPEFQEWLLGSKVKAPTVAPVDLGQSNQARGYQDWLAGQYQQMAQGNGPSLAQGQLQQATDANIRQAMALGQAQQGQGLGYASALRSIADQGAAARQQMAGQSALLRNYEQMQAMQGLGGISSQMRGQDLGGADLTQRGNIANAELLMREAVANQQQGALPALLNSAGQVAMRLAGLGGFGGDGGGGGSWPAGTGYMPGGAPLLDGGFRSGFFKGSSGIGDFNAPVPGAPMYSAHGGEVPGYARGGMPMDSERNDTVPAMLSPGEIVIPRSVTLAPDAPERAAAFVAAIMEHRKSAPRSDKHPMVMHADMERKRKKAA
jgi:hypothetical protein